MITYSAAKIILQNEKQTNAKYHKVHCDIYSFR